VNILSTEIPIKPKLVLLCDDNLLNRKLITAFLHGSEFRIIETDNGYDCINTAINSLEQIDIILLDIGLKDISGVEVCQSVRASHKEYLQHLPIIAYTAHAMEEDCREYLASGFSDVLIKPIIQKDLFLILEKHLSCRTVKM
jgi:CheY-like chemotaxis protein